MTITFDIRPATADEVPEIARINMVAFSQIPVWKLMTQDMDADVHYQFLLEFTRARFESLIFKYFVGIDTSNGTMAGCTGLKMPSTKTPPQPNSDLPPGINKELAGYIFGTIIPKSKNFGYDSTKHGHRAGTFVLPEYQGHGLGTLLTRHCNAISDAASFPTYTGAFGSARKMFANEGFVELDRVDIPLKDYGGPNVLNPSYTLYREAHSGLI